MNAPPVPADPQSELQTLLTSRFALIVIESRDELRVVEMLREASLRVRRGRYWGVYQWTVTEGLRRIDVNVGGSQLTLADPGQLLKHLKATPTHGIYVLLDFHPYLTDPVNVRMLKDIVQGYAKVPRTVVLLSHEIELPEELKHFSAQLKLGLPTREERRRIVLRTAHEWQHAQTGSKVQIDQEALEKLVDNLSGLSAPDTERLARQAIFNDGAITMADLPGVMAAKYQLLNRGGTLYYEPDTAKFADVGGLKNLRQWLTSRKLAFEGKVTGLDPPKGVMLLGVQGCGKSLAARAAAGIFSVPLLRLDFGALYSKWHGESEKNLRESLHAAESLAPCVLWIDEIEKAIASGEGDGGVSRRVLGTFLTWLADQRARIFVVATANDITSLPPELVRKGRFDEIFFVDLPNAQARADILAIHAAKRGIPLNERELAALAARSEGFSGAELEQAIVSALYSAHADNLPISAARIAREMQSTRPLSVVMAEQVESLRAWARERTVPAD